MYHGADYYWQGKHKGYNFFTAVPLGLTAQEQQAWMHFGGFQELYDELGNQFGVKGFLAGNTGCRWAAGSATRSPRSTT
jgi:TRAP-type mannitol/chloroaromatic compound transport system substrate-binding protein